MWNGTRVAPIVIYKVCTVVHTPIAHPAYHVGGELNYV